MTDPQTREALHYAALAVVGELDPQRALQRIADVARNLLNARYAAIGVPDASGKRLALFVTSGMPDDAVAAMAHPPVGEGLLGMMLREERVVTVDAIAADDHALGFPANHPPMLRFLGAPIIAHGHRYGQLYITDRLDGQPFNDDDCQLVETLAAFAAAALRNAALYADLVQRNDELATVNAVALAVNAERVLDTVLQTALSHIMQLFDISVGEVYLREPESGALIRAIHAGDADVPALWQTARFAAGQGAIGKTAAEKTPCQLANLQTVLGPAAAVAAGTAALVLLPLTAQGDVVGVMALLRPDGPLTDEQMRLAQSFSGQLGLAIENAALHQRERQQAVINERDRISMDMHDGVLQSLNMIRMTLAYSVVLLEKDRAKDVQDNLVAASEGLDAAAADMRAYIANLRPVDFKATNLRDGLGRLVAELRRYTSVAATLAVADAVPADVPLDIGRAIYHITQEALANIARHANASAADVALQVRGDRLFLTVRDDGDGFVAETVEARYGLGNMQVRAQAVGGQLVLDSTAGQGATITFSVPLAQQ